MEGEGEGGRFKLGLGTPSMFCGVFCRITLPWQSRKPGCGVGGGLVPSAPLEPSPTGTSTVPREAVGAAAALQPARSLPLRVPLLAGEGATLRCRKNLLLPFCREQPGHVGSPVSYWESRHG